MKVLRYDVPVDDAEHEITCGRVLHVDCRQADTVTFWATDDAKTSRIFRVFATGQNVDDPYGVWTFLGTALTPATWSDEPVPRGFLVWHLFEKTPF